MLRGTRRPRTGVCLCCGCHALTRTTSIANKVDMIKIRATASLFLLFSYLPVPTGNMVLQLTKGLQVLGTFMATGARDLLLTVLKRAPYF